VGHSVEFLAILEHIHPFVLLGVRFCFARYDVLQTVGYDFGFVVRIGGGLNRRQAIGIHVQDFGNVLVQFAFVYTLVVFVQVVAVAVAKFDKVLDAGDDFYGEELDVYKDTIAIFCYTEISLRHVFENHLVYFLMLILVEVRDLIDHGLASLGN
jgi:hypothetical protein